MSRASAKTCACAYDRRRPSVSNPGANPRSRRRARRTLLQALYAWQFTRAEALELEQQFAEDNAQADHGFFSACLHGVLDSTDELDALYAPYLDRDVKALNHVERAILRAATFELNARPDVPVRVAINEWVELAKQFGAEQSFRYVNGVLDRVARDLRAVELAP